MVAVVEEILFFERINGGGGRGSRDMRSRVYDVVWKAAASDHRLPTVENLQRRRNGTDLPKKKQGPLTEAKTAPQ